MPISVPPSPGHRSSFRRNPRRPLSDINVTPFVDVMLVLLIVFMVTAPLLTVGVPVELPESQAKQIVGQDEPLVITVTRKQKIFLQETTLELDELVPRLSAIAENKKDSRIFLRADKSITYGFVMSVMGVLNRAGYSRVALITEVSTSPPEATSRAR